MDNKLNPAEAVNNRKAAVMQEDRSRVAKARDEQRRADEERAARQAWRVALQRWRDRLVEREMKYGNLAAEWHQEDLSIALLQHGASEADAVHEEDIMQMGKGCGLRIVQEARGTRTRVDIVKPNVAGH